MVAKEVVIYSLLSVLVISLISLIGIITLSIKKKKLDQFLIYFVSFSAGALFGGAFLHLLPEIIGANGFNISISYYILFGIVLFFALEKVVHWHHCHSESRHKEIHSFAIMNLVGDGFHNLLDGIIVGASYLVSLPTGIVTTLAVILHEIPQEIGDFGVLLHGGFSRFKALMWNLISALVSFIGLLIVFLLNNFVKNISLILVPIAIGGFLYIAGSDLIPELHKDFSVRKSIWQLIFFLVGIGLMALFVMLE